MMRQRRRAKARRRSRAETAVGYARSFLDRCRPGEAGKVDPVSISAGVGVLARDVLFFVLSAGGEGERERLVRAIHDGVAGLGVPAISFLDGWTLRPGRRGCRCELRRT